MSDEGLENLSDEEKATVIAYAQKLGMGTGVPNTEEKQGIFQIFNNIIDRADSTKVANFSIDDLHNVRVLKSLAKYSEINGLADVSGYFIAEAEIVASTSLGLKAKLLDTLVTQKRKSEAKIGLGGKKEPWFKKKETEDQD